MTFVDRTLGGLSDSSHRQGAPRFGGVIGKQVELLRGPATVAGEPAPSGVGKTPPLGASAPGKAGSEAMNREPGNLP